MSAKRTAASAALAARELHRDPAPPRVGLLGCGRINWEVARFLKATLPAVESTVLFDTVPARAEACGRKLEEELGFEEVRTAESIDQ